MQCYEAMEVASIILKSEVAIQGPECTTVSGRLEHFLHANIEVASLIPRSCSADQIAYFQGLILT